MDKLISRLSSALDSKDIKVDAESKAIYGRDWIKVKDPNPCAITFPRHPSQLQEIVRICNELKVPFVGSGGRTGLSGGATALNEELIISFEKMNQIYEIDRDRKMLLCDAGVTTKTIQSIAADNDLFYPVEFSSSGSSHIGGNIATNAGGINVLKYGMTKNYISGIDVIAGNGSNINLDNGLAKDATGPALKDLFIGSEGILGLIYKCRIRLIAPRYDPSVYMLGFSDIKKLNEVTSLLMNHDLEALELINRASLELVISMHELKEPLTEKFAYYLLIESSDNTLEESLLDLIKKNIIIDTVKAEAEAHKENIWKYRMLISESATNFNPIKFDIAVPVENFSTLVESLEWYISKNKDLTPIFFGHLGDGNLHANFIQQPDFKAPKENLKNISSFVFQTVMELRGSISAEHGIGSLKYEYFKKYGDKTKREFIKNAKKFFDEKNLLNPGKLV